MRNFQTLRLAAASLLVAVVTSPAFAGGPNAVPAPILGAGAGALALLGLGYYGLAKRRGR